MYIFKRKFVKFAIYKYKHETIKSSLFHLARIMQVLSSGYREHFGTSMRIEFQI